MTDTQIINLGHPIQPHHFDQVRVLLAQFGREAGHIFERAITVQIDFEKAITPQIWQLMLNLRAAIEDALHDNCIVVIFPPELPIAAAYVCVMAAEYKSDNIYIAALERRNGLATTWDVSKLSKAFHYVDP